MTDSWEPKTVVIDMDDVSLDNVDANGLHWLYYLKGKFPKFKATIFVIPNRCTKEWLAELYKNDWLELGMHGYNHEEEEDITQEMLQSWPILPRIYKGPNWKVTAEEADLLAKNGFILAVKSKIPHLIEQWPLDDPRAVHGHCWVEADWKALESLLTDQTEFLTIAEAVRG